MVRSRYRKVGAIKKRAFTTIEIVVAVAMVIILAAVVVPLVNPGQESDLDRARTAARELAKLREAINGFEPTLPITSFKQVVGKNPQRLSDLTTRIQTTGSNSLNSCGTAYTATDVSNWSTTNPYWDHQVTPAGATIAEGYVAQDLIVWNKFDAATAQVQDARNIARIRMPSVTRVDAENLALIVDGDINGQGVDHTVSFTPSGANPIRVDYVIMFNNC